LITMELILNVTPENLNRHLPVRGVRALLHACKANSYRKSVHTFKPSDLGIIWKPKFRRKAEIFSLVRC